MADKAPAQQTKDGKSQPQPPAPQPPHKEGYVWTELPPGVPDRRNDPRIQQPAVCRLPPQEHMVGIKVETKSEALARQKAEAEAEAARGAQADKPKYGTQPLSSEETRPRRK